MRLGWLGRLVSGAQQGHPLNEFMAEHERVDEADPALFDGLPPHALRCYRALGPAGHSEIAAGALLAR